MEREIAGPTEIIFLLLPFFVPDISISNVPGTPGTVQPGIHIWSVSRELWFGTQVPTADMADAFVPCNRFGPCAQSHSPTLHACRDTPSATFTHWQHVFTPCQGNTPLFPAGWDKPHEPACFFRPEV